MNFVALFAALIHVYIFALESFLWTKPKTRRVFKMSESDAVITQKLAYNQGFYNLFLALAIIVAFTMGPSGRLLMDYAMASILAAAVVLFASSPGMLRAVLIQGLPGVVYFTLRWL